MKRLRRFLPALALTACAAVLLTVPAGAATPRELADEYCYHTNAAWCVDNDGDGTRESAPQLHPRFTEEGIEHLRERGRYYDPNDVVEPDPTPTPTPTPTPAPTPAPGSPPPTPGPTGATLTPINIGTTGVRLTLANHTGSWWYKRTAPTVETTCNAVASGYTVRVSPLTAGTSYVYTAYSDSACGTALASAAFQTLTTVSNLLETSGANPLSVGIDNVGNSRQWATAFTVGSNPGGYTLASVSAFFGAQSGSPGDITVAIHAASGNPSNPAASALMTLTGSNPATEGVHEFTCPANGNCYLAMNTAYYLVMSAPNATGNGNNYKWHYTTSANETKVPPGNGWSIADDSRYKQGTGNWQTDSNTAKFQVAATANTTSVGLTATVANSQVTLTLSNGPANWWFKIDTAGSCTAASGKTVSGIGGYTGYHTVQAYSNDTCSTQIASTDFTVN